MDISKLKSQLNGLNRTKWNTKETNQRKRILKEKYKAIGKELPKYLNNGNITDNKLNKALKSLNTFYNRAINTEKNNISTSLSQPKYYKDFVKQRQEQINDIKKELSSYPIDIQKAYVDNNLEIGVSRIDIKKESLDIPSLKELKDQAKGMSKKVTQVTKDILESYKSKSQKEKIIKELLNGIMETEGIGLLKDDMKQLDYLIKNVGYLESDILIDVLNTRIERAYYEIYKDSKNLNDPDSLFADLYQLLSRYDRRTYKNIRVK